MRSVSSTNHSSTSRTGDGVAALVECPSPYWPDDLVRRLTDDGYLFLRGLLEPSEVLAIRGAVLDVLDAHGWLEPGSPPDEARARSDWSPSGGVDPIVRDGFLAVQGLECIHKLAYCAELVTLLEAVLGASVFVYPKKPIRLIWPNQSALRHQDFPFFQGSVDALTAWVPLGECPTTMGGLRVLPGSHRLGVLPHSEKGPGLALRGNLPGGWATADFRPGDVVIFHHFLIHDASPNRSDRFRVSVDFRYQPYGDPVCRPGLQPLYQSEGWREVTRHWSSRRWVALPDDPAAVVRKEWVPPAQAHTLELPASRFAGGTRVQKRSRP